MINAQFLQNLRIVPATGNNILDIVAGLINTALYIAGILAFIYLIYAGFQYITSGGDSTQAEKAKKNIAHVIIGIIIIALSYLIIQFVFSALGGKYSSSGGTNNGSNTNGNGSKLENPAKPPVKQTPTTPTPSKPNPTVRNDAPDPYAIPGAPQKPSDPLDPYGSWRDLITDAGKEITVYSQGSDSDTTVRNNYGTVSPDTELNSGAQYDTISNTTYSDGSKVPDDIRDERNTINIPGPVRDGIGSIFDKLLNKISLPPR